MLSSNHLAPVSVSCGLLKAPQERVVEAFLKWQTPLLQPLGCSLNTRTVSGHLDDVIESLLPLTSPVRTRHLFIGTKTGWTAFFDNGWRGTDAGWIPVLAGRCHCEALRIVAQQHTMSRKVLLDSRGSYGAVIMEVFNPDGTSRRTVFAANDGGKWKFGQSGQPFEFENVEAYGRKSVKERFTLEMLGHYLRQFKAYPFENDWYVATSEHPAILVSRLGNLPTSYKEHLLAV